MHFLFGAYGKKVFLHAFAGPQTLHVVVRQQLVVHPLSGREHPHAAFTKGLEQSAVFELAHDARADAVLFKPMVQSGAHGGVARRQQHRHIGQAGRKLLFRRLDQRCGAVPGHRGRAQCMVVELDVGIARRGAVRENHVQTVQGQVTQQLVEFTLVAEQAQMGFTHHGLHDAAHHQFGQAVRNARSQANGGRTDRIAHQRRQVFAQLKNLVGLLHGGQPGIGQHQAATHGFEQGVAQGTLQLPHLGAHGLHRHVELVGRTGDATLLGHDPEVVQVLVVEGGAHGQIFQEC